MNFSHEVIICTKDRPIEIESILNSLTNVERDSNFGVIVIENSENQINKIKTKEVAAKFEQILNLSIYDSAPGLPSSRNLALEKASADLLTFLDDDVLVYRDFFTNLDLLATEETNAAGFGGIILTTSKRNTHFYKLISNIINRFLDYVPIFAFYFLRSRWNNNVKKRKNVIWIPGCAMSFRSNFIKGLNFNEALENGPTKGYALGEDFDFTFKLSKLHPLVQDPSIKMQHLLSSTNRSKSIVMEEALGRWIAYQDKVLFHPIVIPVTFTIMLLHSVFSIFSYKKLTVEQRLTFVRLRSYLNEIYSPRLV